MTNLYKISTFNNHIVKKKHKVNKTNKKEIKKAKKKDYFSYYLIGGIVLIFAILLIIQNGGTETKNKEIKEGEIVMNFFYLNTCPHCHEQMEFHKELELKYPQLNIQKFELTEKESKTKFDTIIKTITLSEEDEKHLGSVPFTIIGEEYNIGFGTADTTGKKIEAMIEAEIAKKELEE